MLKLFVRIGSVDMDENKGNNQNKEHVVNEI